VVAGKVNAVSGPADVLELVQRALNDFEDVSLEASTRRALRIAGLRGDSEDAWWFRADLRPIGGSSKLLARDAGTIWPEASYPELKALQGALAEEWMQERTPAIPPDPMGTVQRDVFISGSITHITQRINLNANAVEVSLQMQVLERIRHRTFAYLCRCEAEITVGAINATIFDRHRRRVDRYLAEWAPHILEKLNAAYSRRSGGDKEALSHAVQSCRRILKAVADTVFPPTEPILDANGQQRLLGEEQYVNRLWQFMSESAEHQSAAARLSHAVLKDFGNRIDRLNQLDGKGVHGDVTPEEADLCLIQTYLLTGEALAAFDARADGGSAT